MNLDAPPGPLSSVLLFLLAALLILGAGLLGPTLEEVLERQPPAHYSSLPPD